MISILSYGASELSLATTFIQRAIDEAAEAGGGTVLIPAGHWITGTLHLRSHVHLHLAEGALLEASEKEEDFDRSIPLAVEAPGFTPVLLYAEDAEDIAITGTGVIDEKSLQYPDFRPMLLRMNSCRKIVLRDVTLQNPGAWCAHFVCCQDVLADHVTIYGLANSNNDGFDLDGCVGVMIRNCTITSSDDSIVLKSTTMQPTQDILVSGCLLSSGTAGFKLGTSSRSGFRNITVSDCIFRNCRTGAIKLMLVDGGILEQVFLHDLILDQVEGPLFVRLGDRGSEYEQALEMNYEQPTASERVHSKAPGIIRDVRLSNLIIRVATDAPDKNGIMLTGIPDASIERLSLENIDLELYGGYQGPVPPEPAEDEARYPEQYFFGILPCSVLFLRHVRDLTLRNVAFRLTHPDVRPPFFFRDVQNVCFERVTLNGEKVEIDTI